MGYFPDDSGAYQHLADTLANRPAASADNAGSLYFATDVNGGTLYRSNGSGWVAVALGLTEAPLNDRDIFCGGPLLLNETGSAVYQVPNNTSTGEIAVWMLSGTATESVNGVVTIPAGWTTATIHARWEKQTANNGNCRLVSRVAPVTVGADADANGTVMPTNPTILAVSGTQYQIQETQLGTGLAVTAGQPLHLHMMRTGGHVDDTLEDDWGFWGWRLAKAS